MSALREWMNTGAGKWLTIVLCLLLIGGAVAFWVLRPSKQEGAARAIMANGLDATILCKACGHTGQQRVAWDTKFPVPCPKCGKVEAVVGFRCAGCRRIIERRPELVYRCPHADCRYLYDKRTGPGQPDPPGLTP